MPDNPILNDRTDINTETSAVTLQKWGGIASFLLALAFISAQYIYLVGDLRAALGPLSYNLADFLYGPVWAASLVTTIFALRERISGHAPRRMTLALLAAMVAAVAMVAVACIRSTNRQYHLHHPELHLETSSTVLLVWNTLVTGVNATGWHFLGWAQVLVGLAGWTSHRLPRLLCLLFLVGGTASLVVYLVPTSGAIASGLGVVVSVWLGILLLKAKPRETQVPGINASQPDQA